MHRCALLCFVLQQRCHLPLVPSPLVFPFLAGPQIAIDNPPARGEQMRVFNQFTEQFRWG